MKRSIGVALTTLVIMILVQGISAQVDEICGETGGGTPWLNSPFVYGKVILSGFATGSKLPKVTVVLTDRQQSQNRFTIDRSGNYCFRNINGNGGTLVVEVEGLEIVRRSLPSFGPEQHREDFEIFPTHMERRSKPGSISAKYAYQRNEKNADLYAKAEEAERDQNQAKAGKYYKEIVTLDPADFVSWAKLGSALYEQVSLIDAEAAYRRSLEAKPEYAPAMINLGRILLVQKKVDEAVGLFEKAIVFEPNAPRAYQLLGEAYLLARKGTLGVQALNEAIRLDPVGMAECHLLIARLYDVAGAKTLAAREYKLFLTKVREHPDKKKFEKYIKDNRE